MKIIGERCNGMFLDIREAIQKKDPKAFDRMNQNSRKKKVLTGLI